MPISPPDSNAPSADWDAFFESHGEAKLRMLVQNGGWPQSLMLKTVEWLNLKDNAAGVKQAETDAEQLEIARSARDAAWAAAEAAERSFKEAARAATAAERQAQAAEKANTRATIALFIAFASLAAALTGTLLDHFGAQLFHLHGASKDAVPTAPTTTDQRPSLGTH